jgi:uncharacterized protein DUF3352
VRRASLLVLAAALVAGCGSGSGSKQAQPTGASTGAAAVAPKSSVFVLRLNTAFASPEWATLKSLLDKFPDGEKLFAGLSGKGVDFEQDVKPALGPETDVVAVTAQDLSKGTFVGLTQPANSAKLDALLAKDENGSVSEEIGDWRVIADKRPTIDAFKRARNGGVLADSDSYKAATEALPAGALATLYLAGSVPTSAVAKQTKTAATGPVPGLGRLGWIAGAVTGKENGFALDLRLQGDEIEATPFTAELPAEVPAGASVFIDFKGLDATLDELRRSPALSQRLGQAEKALSGLIDEVVGLFKGEGAFYARPGPEYTLVVKVADEASARATLDKVGTLVGAATQKAPEQVDVDGVSANKLSTSNATIYYAVFDGKVVITNAASAIRALKTGPRLAGSQAWRDAVASAGMPDETAGILYADVPQLVPLLERLTKNKSFAPQVKRNLAPLSTGLLYGSVDGSVYTIKGFVSVR